MIFKKKWCRVEKVALREQDYFEFKEFNKSVAKLFKVKSLFTDSRRSCQFEI
ncbi:MAG: hypothetical protein KAT34_16025 [Candidatus Aminicenantes bacterium]|nr:hypothetical protein [Candidatus Aminicenantes bacterium]